jgi:uncharacterized protein (UPF0332 family)
LPASTLLLRMPVLVCPLPSSPRARPILAGYHAAMAFVLEKTGKAAKTHSGLRSEFARLARIEPRIDPRLVGFLARAYTLKSAADYGVDPLAAISVEQASEASNVARQFIDTIAELIG